MTPCRTMLVGHLPLLAATLLVAFDVDGLLKSFPAFDASPLLVVMLVTSSRHLSVPPMKPWGVTPVGAYKCQHSRAVLEKRNIPRIMPASWNFATHSSGY